jgi:hypothetical protein
MDGFEEEIFLKGGNSLIYYLKIKVGELIYNHGN